MFSFIEAEKHINQRLTCSCGSQFVCESIWHSSIYHIGRVSDFWISMIANEGEYFFIIWVTSEMSALVYFPSWCLVSSLFLLVCRSFKINSKYQYLWHMAHIFFHSVDCLISLLIWSFCWKKNSNFNII